MLPLLRKSGVIQNQKAFATKLLSNPALQTIQQGLFIPGTLIDELLQRLFVILGALFDRFQPRGQRLDALTLAIQQNATQVRLAPPPAARMPQRPHHVVQERRQILPQASQRPFIHAPIFSDPKNSAKIQLTE